MRGGAVSRAPSALEPTDIKVVKSDGSVCVGHLWYITFWAPDPVSSFLGHAVQRCCSTGSSGPDFKPHSAPVPWVTGR